MGLCYKVSLFDEVLPPALKEVAVCPFLKMPSSDPIVFDNYWQISILLFLGNVVEKVVSLQLMRTLEESRFLSVSFQTGI